MLKIPLNCLSFKYISSKSTAESRTIFTNTCSRNTCGHELNTNLSTAKTTPITDKTRGRMNIGPLQIHVRCKIMLLKETSTETSEFPPGNSTTLTSKIKWTRIETSVLLPRSIIQRAPLLIHTTWNKFKPGQSCEMPTIEKTNKDKIALCSQLQEFEFAW